MVAAFNDFASNGKMSTNKTTEPWMVSTMFLMSGLQPSSKTRVAVSASSDSAFLRIGWKPGADHEVVEGDASSKANFSVAAFVGSSNSPGDD